MQGHNRRAHFWARLSLASKNRHTTATRQLGALLNSLTVDLASLAISATSRTVLAGSILAAVPNTFGDSATFEQVR